MGRGRYSRASSLTHHTRGALMHGSTQMTRIYKLKDGPNQSSLIRVNQCYQ